METLHIKNSKYQKKGDISQHYIDTLTLS